MLARTLRRSQGNLANPGAGRGPGHLSRSPPRLDDSAAQAYPASRIQLWLPGAGAPAGRSEPLDRLGSGQSQALPGVLDCHRDGGAGG